MKIKFAFLLLLCFVLAKTFSQTKTNFANAKMNAYISNLMNKMTIDEKIGQLNLVTPGGAVTGSVVSSDVDTKIRNGAVGGLFGITGAATVRQVQDIAVKNSRLHIPLFFGLDIIHGHRTIFPIPLGMAASWDTALIEQSAAVAAKEGTAEGLNWAYSPMVDIARDPRWGRVAEGSGEDPYLGGKIAAAMVRGYQGKNYDSVTKLMACVKHFALYGAAEAGRDYNTVDMSRIRMYEDYLPPYKAAVDAGVGSVMSSFNEIDGVPATANKWLLTDLLRKQWGFTGFVVSDYTAVSEMINHGLGDLQTVSARALNAGLDMDMVSEGFLSTLKKSLQEGKTTQQQIDAACRRILEAKYKMGLFTDPYKYMDEKRAATDVMTPDNRAMARLVAEHSCVLLKNANNTLPLKKSGTIALVGPLAESQRNMLGTWAVSGDFNQSISIATGMKNVGGNGVNILYAKGANLSDDTSFAKRVNAFGTEIDIDKRSPQEMMDEAVNLAKNTDVTVAVLGEAADMTGESSSMTNIELQPSQHKLLEALIATGKPVVVVLMSGRPMVLNYENKNASAILETWFPGTEAGNAIADVLFGNYNPSGKLTMSFPGNVGQIPIYYNHKNTGRPFHEGDSPKFKSDYLDASNDPLYPFGYGLSYSNFTYGDVKLDKATVNGNGTLQASVTVTNNSNIAGEETAQLYISDPVASVTRAVEELKGFQKIKLNGGESKQVTFTITTKDLSFYNCELKYVWEPGDFVIRIGGNSRDVKSANVKWMK